jgi:rhamnogalacturonyl hydrolase YesR
MSTHALSFRRAIGVTAAALVLAAGCASSNSQPQDETPSPATSAAPAAPAASEKAPAAAATQPAYSVPYRIPKIDEVTATLQHVRDRLDAWAPVPQGGSSAASTERRQGLIGYPIGVAYAGMIAAYEATGDKAFADFDARRFEWIAEQIKRQTENPPPDEQPVPGRALRNPVRGLLRPNSLDSCGAMNAAFVKAQRANIGPDMSKAYNIAADYVSHKQFRLEDGTLARNRPFKNSLWGDDMFMGTSLLGQMGALTGDRSYFDDAAKNIVQMSQRLFIPSAGLFTHAWNAETGDNQPTYFWGRANGWNIVAMAELLSVLPDDHPQRDAVLKIYRAHAKGLASVQSGSGLWHQMLDRSDSYLEESCSAMYTYAIARGVNRGWLSSEAYGPVAISGWIGVTTQITPDGHLKNVCPGTSYGGDYVYYYHRPAIDDIHGYGPTLMAGAEIIKLLKNDHYRFEVGGNSPIYVTDKKRQPTSRE